MAAQRWTVAGDAGVEAKDADASAQGMWPGDDGISMASAAAGWHEPTTAELGAAAAVWRCRGVGLAESGRTKEEGREDPEREGGGRSLLGERMGRGEREREERKAVSGRKEKKEVRDKR